MLVISTAQEPEEAVVDVVRQGLPRARGRGPADLRIFEKKTCAAAKRSAAAPPGPLGDGPVCPSGTPLNGRAARRWVDARPEGPIAARFFVLIGAPGPALRGNKNKGRHGCRPSTSACAAWSAMIISYNNILVIISY